MESTLVCGALISRFCQVQVDHWSDLSGESVVRAWRRPRGASGAGVVVGERAPPDVVVHFRCDGGPPGRAPAEWVLVRGEWSALDALEVSWAVSAALSRRRIAREVVAFAEGLVE